MGNEAISQAQVREEQLKIEEVAKKLFKTLISRRTLIFTSDAVYNAVTETHEGIEEIDVDAVVKALDFKLAGTRLVIHNISDRDVTNDVYVIAPEDMRYVKIIADTLAEESSEEMLVKIVSKIVEEWESGAKSHGPAYVYVKLAEAWGVEFSRQYLSWHKNVTGVVKLCVEDACIYGYIGYGSDGSYIYKSLYYTFDYQ